MVRLDEIIGEVLGIKVAAARKIVEAGEVTIADEVQTNPHWQASCETQQVLKCFELRIKKHFGPQPFFYPAIRANVQVVFGEWRTVHVRGEVLGDGDGHRRPFAHRVLLVNKPQKCVCERFKGSEAWCRARGVTAAAEPPRREAEASERGVQTLWDLVPPELWHAKLGAVSRLDVNTTGLIMMGTDGGLQSIMMHPSAACRKAYVATLALGAEWRLRESAPEEFAKGLVLANGHACQPAQLEVLERAPDPSGDPAAPPVPVRVRVTLVEGRNHQVKKMVALCGGNVCQLHRESIGGLSLADLPGLGEEGSVRLATPDEEEVIRQGLPPRRTTR